MALRLGRRLSVVRNTRVDLIANVILRNQADFSALFEALAGLELCKLSFLSFFDGILTEGMNSDVDNYQVHVTELLNLEL